MIVESMRESPNPVERNGIFLGYVAADGSPVVVDRELLFQHSHILGATGTNKSSMGLTPHIEQILSFPDTSMVLIDLKADTPELYHAANSAMKKYRGDMTKFGALKMFSLENDTGTHVYNPFLTYGCSKRRITSTVRTKMAIAGLRDYLSSSDEQLLAAMSVSRD